MDITEKIREACDNNLYTCGIFIDLQKAFDTVNHNILLEKLSYYGVRGLANNWFRSFILSRSQYTTINGISSEPHLISHGVPQGSVLGPLLFLLFINDIHKAIKNSAVHLFADDTNLLYSNKSLKKVNKYINQDLSSLTQWLRSNKISLNTKKTEIVIFRPKRKTINKNLNFRISGQQIKTTNNVKYLGLQLNEHLDWTRHLNTLQSKLNRAVGILSKIRHYVPKFLLKTVYYTLFNSHLIYGCQIWGQDPMSLRKLSTLQNKAIRIINFKNYDSPTNQLYHENKILKIEDYIKTLNCFLVKKVLQNTSLKIFNDYFTKSEETHNHNTRHSSRNTVKRQHSSTRQYGQHSVKNQAAATWNQIQNALNIDMYTESSSKVKKHLKSYFIDTYHNSAE